jgi:putative ABC transport system permease protein
MFSTFLEKAFRNAARHKGFSIINITALAVGIVSCILLLLWLQDILNISQLHLDVDSFLQILPGVILR